jgi:hypothetical protein
MEERRPVYGGGSTPIPGRFVCALCGELSYDTAAFDEPGRESTGDVHWTKRKRRPLTHFSHLS